MSEKNFTAKTKSNEEEKRKKEKIKEIQDLLDYATETYHVQFPQNFAIRMFEVALDRWIPTKEVVDAIIQEWRVWEEFVTPESYHSFVQYEVERMFTIQTTSTFGAPNLNQYVGNKACIVLSPPHKLSTTVYNDGKWKQQ